MAYGKSKGKGPCFTVTYIGVASTFFILLCGRLFGFQPGGLVSYVVADEEVFNMQLEMQRAPRVELEHAKVQTVDGRYVSMSSGGRYNVPKFMRVEGTMKVEEQASVQKVIVKVYIFGIKVKELSLSPVGQESLGGGLKRLTFRATEPLPGGAEIRLSSAVVEVHIDNSVFTHTVRGPIFLATASREETGDLEEPVGFDKELEDEMESNHQIDIEFDEQ